MPISKEVLVRSDCNQPYPGGMLSDNDLKILWVSRTLTNIDFQYGEELLGLERSEIEVERRVTSKSNCC